MNSWYQIKAQASGDYEVLIYDEIGFWGVTAKQFIDDFKRIPAEAKVTLRLNSPGGDVFDSLAIYNVIKRHPGEVSATIDGLAASGASVVAMAADKIAMPENAFMMIHKVSGGVIGNADDMRDFADAMDKFDSGLVATYAARTGQSIEKITEMLADETWLTAAEAKELGFADEVIEPVKLAASATVVSRFKNLPEGLKAVADPKPATVVEETTTQVETKPAEEAPTTEEITAAAEKRARDILAACTAAGVPEAATTFLDRGLSADEVKARLADADKIRARCAAAKLPDRANGYIKAGMSVKEVADELFDVLIAREGPQIDGKLGPETVSSAPSQPHVLDIRAINKRYQDKEKNFGRKS